MDYQRPPASLRHARSIHALMLRNIKTRAGASYIGFLYASVIPLAHVAILLIIYHFAGRRAPIGNDIPLYLITAILPFVIWSYTHRNIIKSLSESKALLFFPAIKTIDVIVSATLAEILNSTIITIVTVTALNFISDDLYIYDIKTSFYLLALAYFLGASTGSVFAILGLLSPPLMMAGFLLIPLYWITSGALFIPTSLPQEAQTALSFFPLTHVVELMRESIFPSYLSNFPSLTYVLSAIGSNFLIFFILSRIMHNKIVGK